MLSKAQARSLAQFTVMKEYQVNRSAFCLHYLGNYRMKHAFEVYVKMSDGRAVDKGLPIVVLVATSKVQVIQSGESLDIM